LDTDKIIILNLEFNYNSRYKIALYFREHSYTIMSRFVSVRRIESQSCKFVFRFVELKQDVDCEIVWDWLQGSSAGVCSQLRQSYNKFF